jgi:hypothetical protein
VGVDAARRSLCSKSYNNDGICRQQGIQLIQIVRMHQHSNVTNSLKPQNRVTERNKTREEEHSREHNGEERGSMDSSHIT